MEKTKYYLVDASILPEVYSKVVKAKRLLLSGEAQSVTAAVKMAGISRSAYYKYKDKISEYSHSGDNVSTINARLEDSAGVLSSVMNVIYLGGANVQSVNQSIPLNDVANVTITIRTAENSDVEALLEKINNTAGVKTAELI